MARWTTKVQAAHSNKEACRNLTRINTRLWLEEQLISMVNLQILLKFIREDLDLTILGLEYLKVLINK